MSPRPIDIIIPVYQNGQRLAALLESLRACRDELEEVAARLIIGNDSPDDAEAAGVIAAAEKSGDFSQIAVFRNEERRGFVRTVNRALQISISGGRDVLILNSDTVVFPGALRALARIAYEDPRIGFVTPRSNNAAIFSLPHQTGLSASGPEQAYAVFRRLSLRLPEFQYMPTGIGFCLFIKFEILQRFGVFDEAFGFGYQEENDLIMRANRYGYVAVAANRAFVYHVGGCSVAAANLSRVDIDRQNAALVNARYPDFFQSIACYYGGPRFRAERLLAGFLPNQTGRMQIVLEAGAPEFADLARALADQPTNIDGSDRFCVCAETVLPALEATESPEIPCAVIHFGTPDGWAPVLRAARLAPVNIFVLQDTTPLDRAVQGTAELRAACRFVFEHADAVVYQDELVRAQFLRRFRKRPGLLEFVLPSPAEGVDKASALVLRGVTAAVVGEHCIEDVLIPRLMEVVDLEQRQEAANRIGDLTAAANELRERAARLESHLVSTVDELSEARRAADTALVSLRQSEADRRAAIADLRRRIMELESSLSWRVTAPLRAAARIFLERRSGAHTGPRTV